MPIDPSIISGIKQFRPNIPDPIDQYGKSLTLKALMRQDQQAQQSMASAERLKQMYAESGNNPGVLKVNLLKMGMVNEAKSLDEYMQSQSAQTSQAAYGQTLPEGERQMYGADPKAFIKGKIESGVRKPNMQVIETPKGQIAVDLNDPNAPKSWGAKPQKEAKETPADRLAREKFEWQKTHPNMGGRGGAMSPVAQKEIISTDDEIQGGLAAKVGLKNALELNDKAMGFTGAGALSSAGTLLPESLRPDTIDATQNLDNIIVSNVLPQLKATFGGMPTEGERKILIDVQGSVSKSPAVRKAIFERAQKALDKRLEFSKSKAKSLREGTYFQQNIDNSENADSEWSDL